MNRRRVMRPSGLLASLRWCAAAAAMLYVFPAIVVLVRPEVLR